MVDINDVLDDVENILNGTYDDRDEDEFLYIGSYGRKWYNASYCLAKW